MFRKLVSNLAFSPALVGQLGFYAKRLRKEEATRRIGLIFTVLALVVQSFAVFSPPESANAANGDNVIYSGVADKSALLSVYDRGVDSAGRSDIQQIYTHFGISRQDIVNSQLGTFYTDDFGGTIKTVGRSDWGVSDRYPVHVTDSNTTVYSGNYLDGYNHKHWPMKAFIGKRSVDGQWFAIPLDCGNVVYTVAPPPVKHPAAVCNALTVTPLSRTEVRLKAAASASDGATINGYTYTIKNASGATVTNQHTTANQLTVTLPKDGNYTAAVTATTSVGDKTSNGCTSSLSISPEPRCALNPALVQSSPDCKACENDTTLWYHDTKCASAFALTKSVSNITQNITNANNHTAQPGDQLQYTLAVKNTGNTTGTYTLADSLSDVSEYADIVDLGGGVLQQTGSLDITPSSLSNPQSLVSPAVSWATMTIKPGETVNRVVQVRVKSVIPATAMNTANLKSYDCQMSNTFGNTITVPVACPAPKVAETVTTQLPHTGPSENMMFAAVVLAVVAYFYARARQTKQEIRLIRRDLHAGTI